MAEVEVSGWVWSSNVRALFRWLSLYVSYDFGDSEWQAIEHALPQTDDEADGGWYDYPLVGTPPLHVEEAQCVGADPVMAWP